MDAYSSTGFSEMIDSEEVKKALKKQRRAVRITAVIMTLLPLIGFVGYGAVKGEPTIMLTGVVVSIVFLLIFVLSALLRKLRKPYEGIVVDKRTSIRLGDSSDRNHKSRTKRVIKIECDNGKKKKKEVSATVYSFFEVGDRIRYLPQFPQPFEKYRSASDTEALCMFCGRKNDVTQEKCSFCKKPVIR